ncbi:MAG TPA: hypothetical protein VEF55_02580 [Candidatus Binatia bacterium]|nr:hypothetical protein [Candidatus Binatia bacterium]
MTSDLQSARDDLAYMRGLVSGSAPMQATIGEAFVWAGTLYGGQCLLHWLQTLAIAPSEGLAALAIGFGPTIMFCAALGWIIWKDRKTKTTGVASRALGAVFQGAGLANLVMAFVFAYGATKAESFGLWLYHPVVVCMFQGVAWFVAWVILRRAWLGLTAAGWFVTTVALGVALYIDIGAYLFILGVALILLMALPGWAIWRGAKKPA